jgi:tetratricopeptide (TPR) repeat protein
MADVFEDKDPNQALDHYASAICILEQSTSPDHRAISQCLTSMACLYSNCNMLDNALQCQLKALDLNRQILPSNHTSIANNLRNIGLFYQTMNKSLEALRYFDESLSIY